MAAVVDFISQTMIPAFLVAIPLFAFCRGVNVFDTFVEGAKEAFNLSVRLMPYMVGMMVAISVFRASGLFDLATGLLRVPLRWVGMPPEVVPILLLRPISGSGALAIMSGILKDFGPDSFVGRLASTMQGSTETTFYVLGIYFGSVGVKNYRYSVKVGLMADFAAALAALFICRLMFM